MAALLSGLVGPLVQSGMGINTAVNQGAEDRTFRNGWTQQELGVVTAANPGKNVMIVYPDHDASQLVNSTNSTLECQCPNSGIVMTYQCYVFDSGPFTLKGDGSVSIIVFDEFADLRQGLSELGFRWKLCEGQEQGELLDGGLKIGLKRCRLHSASRADVH
jgi:hypothetical protein